ncbi:MAG: zinc ribbon domain-containing protein, partial [Microthrixaceae bacterium]
MAEATTQVAFAPDVFTWPDDDPALIGGRCGECGSITFPRPDSCARCGSLSVERHLLARKGTLWT